MIAIPGNGMTPMDGIHSSVLQETSHSLERVRGTVRYLATKMRI